MLSQSIQLIGPPAHHPLPLLPEFGSMSIGAPDFIRLLMRKLAFNPLGRRFLGLGFLSHLHSSMVTMSQKSSLPQVAIFVSQVLIPDRCHFPLSFNSTDAVDRNP
jgi:hypothetical protein